MYKVSHYLETDRSKMITFAKEHSFAFVTAIGGEYPVATQLPLAIIEEADKLFFAGHMMRKSDHHLALEKNNNCLVVFTGPHAYVSAEWYENPRVGSTVNYMAVHAKGKIFFTNEEGTRAAVKQITDTRIGMNTTASFGQLSEEYINRMVKAIIGFKIEIQNIEAVFALSQSKPIEDQKNIIEHLERRNTKGDAFIAEKMRELLP
jgi:transcriptional regulator